MLVLADELVEIGGDLNYEFRVNLQYEVQVDGLDENQT